MSSNKFNIYDFFIFILIAPIPLSPCFGAYAPIRILAFLFSPFLFSAISKIKRKSELSKFIISFASIFLTYVIISSIWTKDLILTAKELVYYPCHLLILLEIVFFAKFARRPAFSICFAWAFAIFCTFPIATWEFLTGNHLAISKQKGDTLFNFGLGTIQVRQFASVTFGNLNTYGTFLAIGIIFVFVGTLKKNTLTSFCFHFVVAIGSVFFTMINASRGGILAISTSGALFLFYLLKGNNRYKGLTLILLSISLPFVLWKFSHIILEPIRLRMISASMVEDANRVEIIKQVLNIFLDTHFLGLGTGGYLWAINNGHATMAHNLLFEALGQYGILGFVLFVLLLIKIFMTAKKNQCIPFRYAGFAFIFSFPFWSIINSGYLATFTAWTAFGSVCALIEITNDNTYQQIPENISNARHPINLSNAFYKRSPF